MDEGAREPVRIEYRAGDTQGGEVRVRRGAQITVTLHGSPGYGWTPITGVDGPVVLVSESVTDGTVQAVLRADTSGQAELRSTSSFRGDRFGPQTRLWRLVVQVDA
ncbi:hypothetical protein [Streptacidiphilus carbonis]|uniref:hypothetical protein n=1 Tax=Streptacidiphilus carbonis TaxID=105422 RepID=UPI0005AA1455|nr:hypothetical protein [Streptacidiphilus carbonis]